MRSEITESPSGRKGGESGRFALLLFNEANQALLRRAGGDDHPIWTVSASGEADSWKQLAENVQPVSMFSIDLPGRPEITVYFALTNETASGDGEAFFTIEEIRRGVAEQPEYFSPEIRAIVARLDPYVIRIPNLQKAEQDYIYRFRPEKQRNRAIYQIDSRSEALYQSALCRAIKEVKRINERSSTEPAVLDFGAVSYILPSHFGFCLGVQNAIERAYECIAENSGRRIYMLSELIHNPFVNEDLRARGLRYLQSDKGRPLEDEATGKLLWETLTKDDVVIIPAFGATDEDKVRLIEKGIAINRYDATCMLVEKVWKAARRYGREGFTVIIHGKAEHEETKATFSNTAKSGPALIVRNQEEADRLGAVILADDPAEKRDLFRGFEGRHTPGFDPTRDLDRLAVVNQTTLLRNETLRIIGSLEEVMARKFGRENVGRHLNGGSKGDTLCYATQVNQDALQKALSVDPDLAIVVGGKNSSNTFQLFRLCQERLEERAFYIQSEKNILSAGRMLHYSFHPQSTSGQGDPFEERVFLQGLQPPVKILLTGGASCPDGIIQQVIARVNSFFPPEKLRSLDDVLADVE